jgi:hypothetical protein
MEISMRKTLLGVVGSASVLLTFAASATAARADALEVQLVEFRRLCETGDKAACVRFGMALEKNRSHQATWRKAHADWFFWEH